MKVAVVGGTGYVGLVTGIGLAHAGHRVVCADIDSAAIRRLAAGEAPIREAGFDRMLSSVMKRRRISFTTDAVQAAADADVVIIAVGTPQSEDGRADLSQIMSAADRVALGLELASRAERPARGIPRARAGAERERDGRTESLSRNRSRERKAYKVIAVKSTVPVGTCDALRERIAAAVSALPVEFDVVSNPEFLREGQAVRDFLKPDRIVVGASRRRAVEAMRRLYKNLEAPLVVTDPRSSEMLKYACNAYLATRISFINEIAAISESVGADVRRVIEGMRLDPRIGPAYLSPGPGFGGPCLVKDVNSLISFGRGAGAGTLLLDAVLARNEAQAEVALAAMRGMLGGLRGKRVAVLGLSFKAGTADTRDSPPLLLMRALSAAGAEAGAWDPILSRSEEALSATPFLARGFLDAARGADCLVVMNDGIDLDRDALSRAAMAMAFPAIYDARRRVDPKAAIETGFAYRALGVSPERIPRKAPTRERPGVAAVRPALGAAISL